MDSIDLYPTKTRLRLLRLVEAGVVHWDPATDRAYSMASGETLTAAVQEIERAGWVTVPHGAVGPLLVVELAPLGADKLAQADRC